VNRPGFRGGSITWNRPRRGRVLQGSARGDAGPVAGLELGRRDLWPPNYCRRYRPAARMPQVDTRDSAWPRSGFKPPPGSHPRVRLRLRQSRGPRRDVYRRDDRVVGGSGAVRIDPASDRSATDHQRGAVLAAGVLGFLGNEAVAIYRMRLAARSARPPWLPTGCMHAPTASPHWRPLLAPST